jgi:hypothetical protein
MRFEEGLSQGGTIRLEDALSRGLFLKGVVPAGIVPPVDGRWLDLIQRVATIQERTGVILRVPSRDITEEEVKRVYTIDQAVRTGFLEHTGKDEVMFRANRDTARNTWRALGVQRHLVIAVNSEESEALFGRQIVLGKSALVFVNYQLTPDDLDKLPLLLEDPELTSFDIHLISADDGIRQKYYEQWLPAEDKGKLPPGLFAGVAGRLN